MTKIEWTDATWNPIRARNRATGKAGHFCVHVSPGCSNCYAERMQPRFGNPIRYAAQDAGKVDVFLDERVVCEPLSWKRPRMVFVCSMTDLFGEFVEDSWLATIFEIITRAPHHVFQVLTKRPARMQRFTRDWLRDVDNRIPQNLWLGVSVEDQQRADERIPILLDTPAVVRFVSAEPLLGPIRLGQSCRVSNPEWADRTIDWVIVGGESGPGARRMDLQWARSIVRQCQAAQAPCFVKQLGRVWGIESGTVWHNQHSYRFAGGIKGNNINQWPEDLRVREFPRSPT